MENEELTVMESKLLHKVVSLEQKIAELKSQLNQEREQLAAQQKHRELDYKGFQMGKKLTEIIEQLTSELLQKNGDGQYDGNGDMEVLRRNSPKALRSLKEKIERLDFDKDVLEDLKKMVEILILRRKSEEPAADLPEAVAHDVQSTPIVKTLRILEYRSELEEEPQTSSCENAIVYPEPSPAPEFIPIQPPMVPPTKLESNAVFVEEIDTSGVIPRIISTYSVQPEIRGQFTTAESNNEQRDDDGGDNAVPSTSMAPRSKSGRPFMARKRTGGFMPSISNLKKHALVPVRKSRRITKPTPKMQERIVPEELNPKLILKKITHEIHPVLNVTRNASEPASEKAPQVSRLNKMTAAEPSKKDKQHYLVATPKVSVGYFCACGQQYRSMNGLKGHVGTMTGRLKFQCTICQNRYFWYSQLKSHFKDAHNKVLDPTNTLYGCSLCGDTFTSIKLHQCTAHSSLKNGQRERGRLLKHGKN